MASTLATCYFSGCTPRGPARQSTASSAECTLAVLDQVKGLGDAVTEIAADASAGQVSLVERRIESGFLLSTTMPFEHAHYLSRQSTVAALRRASVMAVQAGVTDVVGACSGELGHTRGVFAISYRGVEGSRGFLGTFDAVWRRHEGRWLLRTLSVGSESDIGREHPIWAPTSMPQRRN